MRIASLLPSATEMVYALGLGEQLVAVTHECDHPPEACSKPAVTRSLLPPGLPSAEIDRRVRDSVRDAHTIYALDAERLAALEPDVVLTQSLCEVCAVSHTAVEEAVCSMPRQAQVVSLDPHTLDEVLDSIRQAAEALGVPWRGERLVEELQGRLDAVRLTVEGAPRPCVVCLEWLAPPYRAGHWVPEQVLLAGGEDALGRRGEPSASVEWEEVVEARADALVLMPCGFGAAQAAARAAELAGQPGWPALPAVQKGRVFAVNGSAYFSRPGPRLVDGVELLARILHPDRRSTPGPLGAVLKLVAPPAGASSVENWLPRFEPYS